MYIRPKQSGQYLSIFLLPIQVGILGIQFVWTRDAEIALNNARTDKKIMGTTDQKFLDMLNALIEVTTQDLKKIDRTKFETLVTIHLHQRDIFHALVSSSACCCSDNAVGMPESVLRALLFLLLTNDMFLPNLFSGPASY